MHERTTSMIGVLGLWLTLASSAISGQVLVVDTTSGGSALTTLQAAVDAAQDGDIILARSSNSSDAIIDGKSLTIVGDGAPLFMSTIQVRNIGSTQRVTLRAVRLIGPFVADRPPLSVSNCQGDVALEDMVVAAKPLSNDPRPQIDIRHVERVTVSRCSVTGHVGAGISNPSIYGLGGGSGLYVEDASVAVYDSTIRGGDGGDATPELFGSTNSTFGGAGIEVRGGVLFVAGSSVTGGDGGDGHETSPGLCDFPESTNGPGVFLFPSPASSMTLVDTVVSAGNVGVPATGCAPTASARPAIEANGGSVVTHAGPARSLALASPVREGQATMIEVDGQSGEAALVLISLGSDFTTAPGVLGTLVPAAPFSTLLLALPASGSLTLAPTVPLGFLPTGQGVDIFAQALMAAPGVSAITSSASVLTVLAAGL